MKKILFIEDDSSLAAAYRAKLAHQYQTLNAIDGNDGIKTALEWQPDFIILDLYLPGLNGFEVLRELKKNPRTKKIPVMVLTNLEKRCDEVLKDGAVECFIKTEVTMEEILEKINGYLQ